MAARSLHPFVVAIPSRSHAFSPRVSSNFEDTEDASLDPEPIMVTEEEQDAALAAILDQNIGIGPNGWDPKLERRRILFWHS